MNSNGSWGSSSDNKGFEAKHTWSKSKEDTLLIILDEDVASGQHCDTRSFKPGTFNMIESDCLRCVRTQVCKQIHILSQWWKKKKIQYGLVYDMLNKSGFGWNSSLKCVEIDSDEA